MPSSGTNTATVNLVGAGTNLTLLVRESLSYAGAIAGEGSVSLMEQPPFWDHTQTFAGNNTYSGTTSVGGGGILEINGNTSGQGNYMVQQPPRCAPGSSPAAERSGSPRMEPSKSDGNLAPGPASGIGTLHVNTSGTGGVIFGDGTSACL